LVAKLRANVTPGTSLSIRRGVDKQGMTLQKGRDVAVMVGDIRWSPAETSLGFANGRLPLLVLSEPWADFGGMWVDVAPMGTDAELATTTELVLSETHSKTALAWRVSFDNQTVVAAASLGEVLDQLTAEGLSAIRRAMAGDFSQETFGSLPPDSDETERSRNVAEHMQVLGRAYANALDGTVQMEAATPVGPSRRYELKAPRRTHQPRAQLSLAADTHGQTESAKEYCAEVDDEVLFCGKLTREVRSEGLSFVIDRVGPNYSVDRKWILVLSHKRLGVPNPLQTSPFVPSPSLRLVFAGILLPEVNKLELASIDVSGSD
jgi:hypothetical protein